MTEMLYRFFDFKAQSVRFFVGLRDKSEYIKLG